MAEATWLLLRLTIGGAVESDDEKWERLVDAWNADRRHQVLWTAHAARCARALCRHHPRARPDVLPSWDSTDLDVQPDENPEAAAVRALDLFGRLLFSPDDAPAKTWAAVVQLLHVYLSSASHPQGWLLA
eukprot:CAMPEP_0113324002 /NCGR_PEP_ID=MMETSP0010_2-20120614/16737_1 /TAXON_ID=216773 ORGANISM="Corethron hystrix, Strain 308" /NCGR_SAMPLE_ID=MMETSP0010_2 /ASSEMBLY_ACC=CAM_ASM_000155 /LENGTH=129 /DNA_ID=CAMNT_0000183201 /DNA_START=1 /DNA_END=387 /DNA_ORIENTATION=+ /assembly_acc=CAM_ASM_000155